jgi:hypothetical protein
LGSEGGEWFEHRHMTGRRIAGYPGGRTSKLLTRFSSPTGARLSKKVVQSALLCLPTVGVGAWNSAVVPLCLARNGNPGVRGQRAFPLRGGWRMVSAAGLAG